MKYRIIVAFSVVIPLFFGFFNSPLMKSPKSPLKISIFFFSESLNINLGQVIFRVNKQEKAILKEEKR